MYILGKYVNCIYHYRGPNGRLAVTLRSYVFAKCCVPLKIKYLLTYLLIMKVSLELRHEHIFVVNHAVTTF